MWFTVGTWLCLDCVMSDVRMLFGQKHNLNCVSDISKFSKFEGMCFFSEGEEILKSKMLAFEEMRKRLEEQHAQQLSLLIAEQEREQERLQKVRN